MKIRLRLFVWCCCLMWQCIALGQDTRLQMTLLNEEDGMANSFVNDIIQDSRGLIWVATDGGLHCYDGFTFVQYNRTKDSQVRMTDNRVTSVEEDANGHIWAGTKDGLNIIDPANRTVKYFLNSGNAVFPSKGKSKYICEIEKTGDGRIWVNDGGSIASFFGDSLRYFKTNVESKILEMYADDTDELLLRYVDANPIVINSLGEIKRWKEDIPYRDSTSSYTLLSHFVGEDGHLIVREGKLTYHKFDKTKTKISSFEPEQGSLSGILKEFIEEFSEVDLSGSLIKENILFRISKIFRDESGLVWVATNFGLVKLTYETNEFKTLKELLGISVREMYEAPSGKIYMGAYPPFSFFSYNPKNDLIQQFGIETVWPILPFNEDTLLLGQSGGGFKLFDLNKEEIIFSSKSNRIANNFHSLELGYDNKVWFGAVKGLFYSDRYDLNNLNVYKTPEGEIPFEGILINQIEVDVNNKENLWLATDAGLFLFHTEKGIIQSYTFNELKEKSLLDNEVQQIVQDKEGNVWAATTGGLNYISFSTGVIRSFTNREGLADNVIYTILMDNEGLIWLGTRNGLSRFNPKTETFANFYESDGLAYREFNRGAAMKTRSGRLYFGGLSGFSSFMPNSIKRDVTAFRPFISKYTIYNADEKRQVEIVPVPNDLSKIRLDPHNRNIEFSFAITDYDRPRQANFQVFLEGFDEDWIVLGNKRSVRYTNLDAGAYTFKVRATNKDGIWSMEQATATVVVQEPFWGSDLFFGIILLSIFGVISIFYFSRLAFQQGDERLRNRIANDLHDEVSNTLNNIRIISTEAEMVGRGTKELARIRQMSSNAIEHVQDVIWAIDQEKESIKYLLFRIEDYIDLLLRDNQIPVTFTKELLDPDTSLDFLHRRNLLLIFKEAISNMVKHTYCKKVEIELGNKNGHFFMYCTNYFDKKKEHNFRSGRGLQSMEQRAEAIGGSLSVEEAAGKFVVKLEMEREL